MCLYVCMSATCIHTCLNSFIHAHIRTQAPPVLENPFYEARKFRTNETEEVTFLSSLQFVSDTFTIATFWRILRLYTLATWLYICMAIPVHVYDNMYVRTCIHIYLCSPFVSLICTNIPVCEFCHSKHIHTYAHSLSFSWIACLYVCEERDRLSICL